MTDPILQSALFEAPWDAPSFRRAPGLRPCPEDGWIAVDEVYAAQMSERARLLAERPGEVLAIRPEGEAGARECLDALRRILPVHGFTVEGEAVLRPDGRRVSLDHGDPLRTMGHLVQEDICIMTRGEGGWILSGAVLCFPAGWTLAEKLGHHMTRIHAPIPHYDADLARRVDRLFDGLKVGLPVWRANLHRSPGHALFAAMREDHVRTPPPDDAPYLRSERQCLVKLPQSGAIVFTIHTCMVPRAAAPGLP